MTKNSFTVLLVLIPFLFNSSSAAQDPSEIRALILEDSKLRINGTSNVTDFECQYKDTLVSDTLSFSIQESISDSVLLIKGDQLKLTIESFDCGKRGINRDFRKTLRSKTYPNIEVELLKVHLNDSLPHNAEVLIHLAGETRPYRVRLREVETGSEVNVITGYQDLRMTDFGLSPPSALFGLVKVRDELRIHFTLRIEEL